MFKILDFIQTIDVYELKFSTNGWISEYMWEVKVIVLRLSKVTYIYTFKHLLPSCWIYQSQIHMEPYIYIFKHLLPSWWKHQSQIHVETLWSGETSHTNDIGHITRKAVMPLYGQIH